MYFYVKEIRVVKGTRLEGVSFLVEGRVLKGETPHHKTQTSAPALLSTPCTVSSNSALILHLSHSDFHFLLPK
jgi:hypothetical protein